MQQAIGRQAMLIAPNFPTVEDIAGMVLVMLVPGVGVGFASPGGVPLDDLGPFGLLHHSSTRLTLPEDDRVRRAIAACPVGD